MTDMENIASKKAIDAIESKSDKLRAVARFIHAHPELGFNEKQSSSALIELLASEGFQVERGICGMQTAFRARADNSASSPRIAFIAEYDALPGLGHACGHNLIAIAGAGAAMAVCAAYEKIPGEILCIGTPAEEGGAGKIIMAKAGVFDGLDAAMMCHPSNMNMAIKMALGVVTVTVKFHGKSAHASAFPEAGINALDAMILFFSGINAMRQHISRHERVHGIITRGGDAPNIIPELTEATVLVRALDEKVLDYRLKQVERIAQGAAMATGCRCEFSALTDLAYAPFHPNRTLANIFKSKVESLGVEVESGNEDVGMGSSDIGNVGRVVPTIHPEYAIGARNVVNHTPEFAAAAATDQAVDITLTMAKAMALTAISLLEQPELLKAARSEFDKNEKKENR